MPSYEQINNEACQDSTEHTLRLSLGDIQGTVFYELGDDGSIAILGFDKAGDYAEAHCFSTWQISDWTADIMRDLRAQLEEAEEAGSDE